METPVKTETPAAEEKPVEKKLSAEETKPAESMEEMLREINKNVKKQTGYARAQFISSFIGLVVVVVALLALGMKLFPLIDQVNGTLVQVSTTLEAMKLDEMAKSVTDLANTGTEGIGEALGQIEDAMVNVEKAIGVVEDLDIQGLNDGITKLNEVMEPLAKFFGRK